ncbi:MAG: hypothetical protein ACE5ES_01910 [Candidatus Nanoarchaeia archaeon]
MRLNKSKQIEKQIATLIPTNLFDRLHYIKRTKGIEIKFQVAEALRDYFNKMGVGE